MELIWTRGALADLDRLYEFLAPVNSLAAAHVLDALTLAPETLLANPRIGEKVRKFNPREVRRIIVGHYEMRYEIKESKIHILELWHTREDR